MRPRRVVWIIGSKIALTLGMALPAGWARAPEYWALAPLPGLERGTPVVIAGARVGNVTRVRHRGDTTFLRVRFQRGAAGIPGGRVVQLRQMGWDGAVALELLPGRKRVPSFLRRGFLFVVPGEPDLRHRLPADAPSRVVPGPAPMPHLLPLPRAPSRELQIVLT